MQQSYFKLAVLAAAKLHMKVGIFLHMVVK